MYLHIGKDIIIKRDEIIGIFNIESILDTKEYNCIIETLKEVNRIQDISNGEPKTLVLYKKENIQNLISICFPYLINILIVNSH